MDIKKNKLLIFMVLLFIGLVIALILLSWGMGNHHHVHSEEDIVINCLLLATMDYYSDYQAYPEVEKIEDLTKILLDTNPKDKTMPKYYLEKKDFREGRFEGYRLLDSRGNPYRIKKIIDKDNQFYMIWSIGPNGIDEQGKGDDISNWREEEP